MSVLEAVKSLNRSHVVISILTFGSAFAPGFLTIYFYKPLLVSSLDTIKLLVFSAALTFPIVVLNYFAALFIPPSKDGDHQVDSFLLAMAITTAVCYFALIVAYFAALSFKYFLITVAATQGLLFASMILELRSIKKAQQA